MREQFHWRTDVHPDESLALRKRNSHLAKCLRERSRSHVDGKTRGIRSPASSFLSFISFPLACTLSLLLSPVDLFFFPRFQLSSPKRRRISTEISTKHTPHGRLGSKKANPRAFARRFATWDKDGKSDWLAHRAFFLDWSPLSLSLSFQTCCKYETERKSESEQEREAARSRVNVAREKMGRGRNTGWRKKHISEREKREGEGQKWRESTWRRATGQGQGST